MVELKEMASSLKNLSERLNYDVALAIRFTV